MGEEKKEEMSYVGIAPCGCVRLFVAGDYAATPKGCKSISGALREGLAVERWHDDRIRDVKSYSRYCVQCDPARVARMAQAKLELAVPHA